MEHLYRMIEWLSINYIHLLIALAILLGVHLFRKSIEKFIFLVVKKISGKMNSDWFETIFKAFERPAANWISILGIYLAYGYLSLRYPVLRLTAGAFPLKMFKAATVMAVGFGFYNLDSFYGNALVKLDDKLNLNTSELLKNMVSKVVKAIILILALGMAASEFFDVNGFIAGLGIAGLAVAMAAQDTLGNMIAGAAIVVDRPYDLGDWILCEGVEGEVEELSFRSTRIRTATQEIVYIPNSNMSKSPITNFSRRGFRRVELILQLDFETQVEALSALKLAMEDFLSSQSYIREEGILVKADQMGGYGIGFTLRCFVNTNVYQEYINYKETINLELVSQINALGIKIARQPIR